MSEEEKIGGGGALQDRVRGILAALNSDLYGKEEAVRLALLSAVAGESVFFLGPPGTAKSMISRRISCAFKDIDRDRDYFEYLMNEFSTPDEICGPVSLKKLNEDQYLRLTEGYLPEARVAFLDEIWKSGPAILNTLLTIINERKFHNGKVVQKVPLVSLAAASNELPERGRGLEALWDRFILRVMVNPVSAEEDFFKVVDSPVQEEPETGSLPLLTFGEVEEWQKSIDMVELGDDARKVITAIRKELERRNQALEEKEREAESWYVSDRRWKKIVRILKASAFLNGRDTVDLMDCSLMAYCIWNTGCQQQQVDAIMEEILAEYGIDCSTTIEDLRERLEEFTTPEQFDSLGQEIDSEIKSLQEFKAENKAPFAENAFADQWYRPILLKKIDDSIRKMEDLKLELQKKRDGHGKKAPLPAPKGTGREADLEEFLKRGDDICFRLHTSPIVPSTYRWAYGNLVDELNRYNRIYEVGSIAINGTECMGDAIALIFREVVMSTGASFLFQVRGSRGKLSLHVGVRGDPPTRHGGVYDVQKELAKALSRRFPGRDFSWPLRKEQLREKVLNNFKKGDRVAVVADVVDFRNRSKAWCVPLVTVWDEVSNAMGGKDYTLFFISDPIHSTWKWDCAMYCIGDEQTVQALASVYRSIVKGKDSYLKNPPIVELSLSKSDACMDYLWTMQHPRLKVHGKEVTPGILVSSAGLAIESPSL